MKLSSGVLAWCSFLLGIANAQQIEIPSAWKSLQIDELLRRKEVASLPFIARDQIVTQIFPDFGGQKWSERRNGLLKVEQESAASEKRIALTPYVWTANGKYSDSWIQDGRKYYALHFPSGLNLAVSVGQWDQFIDTWVMVDNRSSDGRRFEISPGRITIAIVRPKVSLLLPLDGDEIGRKIGNGARWRAALVAGLGGMATRTDRVQSEGTFDGTANDAGRSTRVSGTYSGQSTVTGPDTDAQERSQRRAREIRTAAAGKAEAVKRTGLRANTVFPNASINGFVYFKHSGKGKQVAALRVVLENTSFEFPLALEGTK